MVVETPQGARPPMGSPTPLEGPGFVKEVRANRNIPMVGDGHGWQTPDGRPSGIWRGVRADDPEVLSWVGSGPVRIMGPQQWLMPALGKVSATPDKEFPELSQPCAPIEHSMDHAWFTPMIPIVMGAWGPMLPQNPELEREIEAAAWEIMRSHNPRFLWAGWVFSGVANEMLATSVLVDRVPPTPEPLPVAGPAWVEWWNLMCSKLSPLGLAQAVAAITPVCDVSANGADIVARDIALAELVLAREPVLF